MVRALTSVDNLGSYVSDSGSPVRIRNRRLSILAEQILRDSQHMHPESTVADTDALRCSSTVDPLG